MEQVFHIERSFPGNKLCLMVAGRIDATGAERLTQAIEEEIRAGRYRLSLDLSGVHYISSAGIRTLIQTMRQLEALGGNLHMVAVSQNVRLVLEMAGLEGILKPSDASDHETAPANSRPPKSLHPFACRVQEIDPAARMEACLLGDPGKVNPFAFAPSDAVSLDLMEGGFALGLGALGSDFEDCRGRFGELISIGGAAAYLPTDGARRPDYVLARGRYVPRALMLYGLLCRGAFSHKIIFEPDADGRPAPFSDLASAALDETDSDAAGIIMIAEAASLVGASLSISPFAAGDGFLPLEYPSVRDAVYYTTERAWPNTLVLMAGVIFRRPDDTWSRIVRPLSGGGLRGHFHAAVFSFIPVKKSGDSPGEIVNDLFDSGRMQTVMHLVHDDRPVLGVGQSEFIYGTCWAGSISSLKDESR